jgi:hypothetical protein
MMKTVELDNDIEVPVRWKRWLGQRKGICEEKRRRASSDAHSEVRARRKKSTQD